MLLRPIGAEGGRKPVKTPAADVDRPAYSVEEPPEPYLALLGAARQVAAHIVETSPDGLTGAASYMRRASQELIDAVPPAIAMGLRPRAQSSNACAAWLQSGQTLPRASSKASRSFPAIPVYGSGQ